MDDFQTKPLTNFLQAAQLAVKAPEDSSAGAALDEDTAQDTPVSADPEKTEDLSATTPVQLPTSEVQEEQDEYSDDLLEATTDVGNTTEVADEDFDIDALTSDGVPFDGSDTSVVSDMDGDDEGEREHDEAKMTSDRSANDTKVQVVLRVLRSVETQIQNAIRLLEDGKPSAAGAALANMASTSSEPDNELSPAASAPIDGRVVEGVFDGQAMVGGDGKTYSVPPNYASKSKLVEGDMLKLTITPKGSFIYKQIGPIERSRLIGTLGYDNTIGQFYAATDDKRWSVIRASVTYFKGEAGDEIVILIPKSAPSKWAAVENIIKTNPLD